MQLDTKYGWCTTPAPQPGGKYCRVETNIGRVAPQCPRQYNSAINSSPLVLGQVHSRGCIFLFKDDSILYRIWGWLFGLGKINKSLMNVRSGSYK